MKLILLASLFFGTAALAETTVCHDGDYHISLSALPKAPELLYNICEFQECFGELLSKGKFVTSNNGLDVYDITDAMSQKQLTIARTNGAISEAVITSDGRGYQSYSDCQVQK